MNELENKNNITNLAEQYWTCIDSNKKSQKQKCDVVDKKSNTVALITTLVLEYFPVLTNYPERKFIRFQENLEKLLSKQSKN